MNKFDEKRKDRSINRDIRKLEDKKRKWVIGGSVATTLLIPVSLAAGLFSVNVKPSSVNFYFGDGAENVNITQYDPDDYTTKIYSVDVLNEQGEKVTYNVPFDTLDEKVPFVGEYPDMINIGNSDDPAMVRVGRQEKFPPVKNLTLCGSVFSLFGAVITGVTTKYKVDEINDSIDELKDERHR